MQHLSETKQFSGFLFPQPGGKKLLVITYFLQLCQNYQNRFMYVRVIPRESSDIFGTQLDVAVSDCSSAVIKTQCGQLIPNQIDACSTLCSFDGCNSIYCALHRVHNSLSDLPNQLHLYSKFEWSNAVTVLDCWDILGSIATSLAIHGKIIKGHSNWWFSDDRYFTLVV